MCSYFSTHVPCLSILFWFKLSYFCSLWKEGIFKVVRNMSVLRPEDTSKSFAPDVGYSKSPVFFSEDKRFCCYYGLQTPLWIQKSTLNIKSNQPLMFQQRETNLLYLFNGHNTTFWARIVCFVKSLISIDLLQMSSGALIRYNGYNNCLYILKLILTSNSALAP